MVAAIIVREQAGKPQVFIAKRPDDKHQGGLWEFPGGKLENNETEFEGLKRELLEEVGIDFEHATSFLKIKHHYPDKYVLLDVYWVDTFQGKATGKEGQETRWIPLSEIETYQFPEANWKIVHALQVPQQIAISPESFLNNSIEQIKEKLQLAHKLGSDAILLRNKVLSNEQYLEQYYRVQAVIEDSSLPLQLICNRFHLSEKKNIHAIHLNSSELMSLSEKPAVPNITLSASCHNAAELEQAKRLNVDYVFLSPVLKTLSHQESEALGWDISKVLLESTSLPVILLGGLSPKHKEDAKKIGALGVSGISEFGLL